MFYVSWQICLLEDDQQPKKRRRTSTRKQPVKKASPAKPSTRSSDTTTTGKSTGIRRKKQDTEGPTDHPTAASDEVEMFVAESENALEKSKHVNEIDGELTDLDENGDDSQVAD